MLLRRTLLAIAVTATLAGCEPSLPKSAGPSTIQYVVLDPATGQIPLPNDLAWMQAPSGSPRTAQAELLQLFAAQKGFPNDQEMPVTIDIQQWTAGAMGAPEAALDLDTLTPGTFMFLEKPSGGAYGAPAQPYEKTYVVGRDRGTLTLRNAQDSSRGGTRAWKPGSQFVVVLRGGANGARLVGGGQLTPMSTMYLLTRGVDLSDPRNEYLLPGTRDARAALGAQLEQLRQQYLPLFAMVDGAWGAGASQDIVSIQTFSIAASTGTQVVADESAGVMPLPSDFLLDPTTGKVVKSPAFGPLADGIATLDGFSTTAMILTGVRDYGRTDDTYLAVEHINKDTVFLYELPSGGSPVRVKDLAEGAGAGLVTEPLALGNLLNPDLTLSSNPCTTPAGCFTPAIGLQPAVPIPISTGFVSLPPLKEATEYAVIITDGVQALLPDVTPGAEPTLAPLHPTTLGQMLLFTNRLVDASGKSQLAGVSDATAAGLEQMREGVNAAAAALATEKGIAKEHIAMAYTFRTQSITATMLQLAAAPYANAAAFVPGAPTVIPAAALPSMPAVKEVLSLSVPTTNPIDVTTGAMNPDPTKWTPAALNALVVVPQAAAVSATCPGGALKCAPLVVFQHGLGGNKTHVFAIANTLASAGFVVAAIDSPLHGDRAYCVQDAECACPAGVTCTPKCGFFGPAGMQGDAMQIGACAAPSAPVAAVSGRFFVTGNFFRTRDALRQDTLDTSALVLALAPPSVPANAFAAQLAADGIAVDATKVYWIGQSLGGIYGVLNTAANPRIGRSVLNVPGGPLVDVFTNSPSFTGSQPGTPPISTSPVGQLLAAQGITYGTQGYLEFIQVAKWVLDPGDPINFAGHLTGDAGHPTLPDLLNQQPNQQPKQIFGQYAVCDQTIPNPFNLLLFEQIGLTQTPVAGGSSGYTAYNVSGETFPNCSSASGVAHGFLLDPTGSAAATAAGQADAAGYLLNATLPTNPVRP